MKLILASLDTEAHAQLIAHKAKLEALLKDTGTNNSGLATAQKKLAQVEARKDEIRGRAETGLDAEASREFSALLDQIRRLSHTIENLEGEISNWVPALSEANEEALGEISRACHDPFRAMIAQELRGALAPFCVNRDSLERAVMGATSAGGTIHEALTQFCRSSPSTSAPVEAHREAIKSTVAKIERILAGEAAFEFEGYTLPAPKPRTPPASKPDTSGAEKQSRVLKDTEEQAKKTAAAPLASKPSTPVVSTPESKGKPGKNPEPELAAAK